MSTIKRGNDDDDDFRTGDLCIGGWCDTGADLTVGCINAGEDGRLFSGVYP